MAMSLNVKLWRFSHIFLLISIFVVGDAEVCTKKGRCRCEFDNGTYIDLQNSTAGNSMTMYTGSTVQTLPTVWNIVSFYFNPCVDVPLPLTIEPPDNSKKCTSFSLCWSSSQLTKNLNSSYELVSDYNNLGKVNEYLFNIDDSGVYLNYVTGIARVTTTVVLACTSSVSSLVVRNGYEANNAVVIFYSPLACVRGEAHSRHSLGTTLLIILFVLAFVYLVVGCLSKYFLMGARGIEIVPNLSFWRDLPNLVRDGVAFVSNGFKPPPMSSSTPAQSPNPNTYDSI